MARDGASRIEGEFLAALAAALTPGRTVGYLAAVHCSGNADLAARVVRDLHDAGRVVIRGGRCYLPGQVEPRRDDPPPCTDPMPIPPPEPSRKERVMPTENEPRSRVLDFLRTVPSAATREIVDGTGLSRSVALTALRALRGGPIECFGEGTATRYRIRSTDVEDDAEGQSEGDPLADLRGQVVAPPSPLREREIAQDRGVDDIARQARRQWADAALPGLLAELAEHESIAQGLRARIAAAIAARSEA